MAPITRIGLTGGIGSGKSTVAAMLRECGAVIVDTDAIAHGLTAPGGAAIPAIVERFGPGYVTPEGALDRARMRERVFAEPAARQALEAILHPMIRSATEAAAQAAPDGATVVFDVPLLVESGRWRERVQRVLVVDCPEDVQVARVMARNGWSAEAVQRIIAQQASREARRAVADAVILNDGLTLAALRERVRALWRDWVEAPGAVKQSGD